mmetsp:Transcript_19002/g.13801  ORF Transcript_19002/g.13801 Transcript_19002/m.13801 type:complete len:160 (+) Transcript_19002:4181-4660(+)
MAFLFVFVFYFNLLLDNYIDMREYYDVYNTATVFNATIEFIGDLSSLYKLDDDVVSQVSVGQNIIGLDVNDNGAEVLLTDLMNDTYNFSYYTTVVFSITLCLFATYFLVNEVRQMFDGILAYVKQFWNYIDILPPLLIYGNVALLFLNLDGSQVTERVI